MKKTTDKSIGLIAIALGSCFGIIRADAFGATPPGSSTSSSAVSAADSRGKVQAEVTSGIEKRRSQAEQEAKKTLDQDAIAAIAETENAIQAIASGNKAEALAAIERATGKIHILTARSPATALIPVRLDVEAIDVAPLDVEAIDTIADAADAAIDDEDYPAARALLESLISEIRVRAWTLPLATYPAAMKEAARLLDADKLAEANAVLMAALHTLVVVDKVTPLPLEVAQAAINDAQGMRDKDKDAAQLLLAAAKLELERAEHLGYAGNDPEYKALNDEIAGLEKQLEGNDDTASAFTRLKEKMASFFERQSDSERKSNVAAAKREDAVANGSESPR